MITQVKTKKQLNSFIFFVKELYKNDKTFCCPIFSSLKKELNREIFVNKKYTAILCIENGKTVGRLLYTTDKSKHKNKDIGYFSFFDCIDSEKVANELFDYMENDLKNKVDYIEGTFCPYDPDTRRGILIEGFNEPHTILTQYNYPYYGKLLESAGYVKAYDTYTVKLNDYEKIKILGKFAKKKVTPYGLKVDSLNFKNLNRDLNDIHSVLKCATTEINYQQSPDIEMIKKVAKSMRPMVNPKIIKIVREEKTDRAIGFGLILPDYNELLKKSKGKIRPLSFFSGKKKIKGARGILQYLIPEYQGSIFFAYLFSEAINAVIDSGITYFEGGTILEENTRSWESLVHLGGNISKIYRIYGKEITQ